jgi:hypothetical protein
MGEHEQDRFSHSFNEALGLRLAQHCLFSEHHSTIHRLCFSQPLRCKDFSHVFVQLLNHFQCLFIHFLVANIPPFPQELVQLLSYIIQHSSHLSTCWGHVSL